MIPANQGSTAGLAYALRILTTGDVEVRRAQRAFQAGGESFPAGSFVIPMRQPYAAFAQTMLEVPNTVCSILLMVNSTAKVAMPATKTVKYRNGRGRPGLA